MIVIFNHSVFVIWSCCRRIIELSPKSTNMETRVTLRTLFLSFALPILVVCVPGTRAAFYSGNRSVDTTLVDAPWNSTPSDILKKTILSGYDKFSRPAHSQSTINVTLGMSVYHVALDDASGLIELHGWVRMAWNDDKLKWDPSDFGDVKSLHLAYHEIWQPDVVQYNSAAGNINQYDHTHCIVWSDGAVLWVPPARLIAFCSLEMKRWPRDEQTCNITFGSWTYDVTKINLMNEPQTDFKTFKADVYVENEEWELVDVKPHHSATIYDCCEEPYTKVEYVVTLQRREMGRAGVLRVQAAAAVLLALLGHLLPTSTGAAAPRAVLAAAPLSLLALVLFYLNENLPTNLSRNSIDIVCLYTGSLCVSLCSALVSALAVVLSRRGGQGGGEGRPPPDLLRRAAASKAARFLGALDNTSADGGKGWRSIASLLDRLSALLLSALFILLMVIYR